MIVYFHRNPITYEIFYVGIGKRLSRAYDFKGRNPYWENYINKYGNPIVQIVHDEVCKGKANDWERFYIDLLKRKREGGNLVNITSGGDARPCEELEVLKKIKQSLVAYYRNNPDAKASRASEMKAYNKANPKAGDYRKSKQLDYINSPEFKEKSIDTLVKWVKNNPDKNPSFKPEHIDRMRQCNPMHNPIFVEKVRNANIGKKASEETKKKQSLRKKGIRNNKKCYPINKIDPVSNKVIKSYPAIVDALRDIGKKPKDSGITRALKLGCKAFGYKWERIAA